MMFHNFKMIKKSKILSKGRFKCILRYLEEQLAIDLDELNFNTVKSKTQFLSNYNMHDKATSFIALKYLQKNFSLHPIGKDLREQRVLVKNEVPDYYAERAVDVETLEDKIYFCFDVKSKRKLDYFGWVNEGAIHGYKRMGTKCRVPVYLIFVLMENNIPTKNTRYCNILEAPMHTKIARDKNKVLIYS